MHLSLPQHEGTETYIKGERLAQTRLGGRRYQDESTETFEDERQRHESIARLASRISAESPTQSPFTAASGGPLDPLGPSFDPVAWMQAFYSMHLSDLNIGARSRGVAFRNLSVHGFGTATDFQKTVGNIFLDALPMFRRIFGYKGHKVEILQDLEGVLDSGEMLCVLGPPGSGCSTFLKTLAGETHGLYLDDKAYLNYKGIRPKEMRTRFRGEATFTAEDDAHLPSLSVGDTLQFAALARSPRDLPGGMKRDAYAKHLSDVIMAAFGISHTRNTRVGDNVSLLSRRRSMLTFTVHTRRQWRRKKACLNC
jgi:ATP-binding cassette, subfamily G (WHITE), member 2, PDR